MSGFNFSPESFIGGLAVGWGSAYALYRARHRVSKLMGAASGQNQGDMSMRGTDSAYLTELVRYCQSNHLAGARANLTDLLVEPTFITAPSLAAPPDEEVVRDVFNVVPRIHDHPYLHANYNIETIRIEELDNGAESVAILGLPGSGRSTTLQAIALWALGQVDFTPPRDDVQERIEAEEAELKDDERKRRVAERQQVETMAKQSLAKTRGDDDDDEISTSRSTLLRGRVPILVNFNDIILRSRDYGRSVDPAEPIIRAAQHYVGPLTRRTMPRSLYERFEQGRTLLLLDGFDHLPPAERAAKLDWLRALRDIYPQTFIIVTGPATGYDGLVKAGLAPVFLRPMNDVSANRLVDRLTEHWPKIQGGRRAEAPAQALQDDAHNDIRARTAFDITIKTWGTFADPEKTHYDGWMRRVLSQFSSEDLDDALPRLTELAALQLDEGLITVKRLEERATGIAPAEDTPIKRDTGILTDPENRLDDAEDAPFAEDPFVDDDPFADTDDSDEDLDALFGDESDDNTESAPAAATTTSDDAADDDEPVEEEAEEAEPDSKLGREYARLLANLTKAGLLTHFRGDRYRFRYSGFTDYLASLALSDLSAEEKQEKAISPAWNGAFALAALHTDIDDIVALRIDAPSDVLHNNLLEMATWLSYASSRLEWRSTILKKLGNMFVAPTQYRVARERIAAALIGTRDPGVLRVFSLGVTHPNPHVRLLSVLGLGAIRAEANIPDITSLLDDPVDDVKLAAALALGAIGTEPALEEMIVAFTTPNERIQQAIAEAFAAIPSEGYPVLYDAAQHTDMSLRRAAVFGLRRINTTWAMTSVYRRMLEDDQWYVRSAAEIAFGEMNYGDSANGPHLYPPVENITWLRDWIASLGDVAQQTTTPDQFLPKAMQEANPELQELAAANIGQLAQVKDISLLYTALRHRDSRVREASHRALADLQAKTGQPLPAPVQ